MDGGVCCWSGGVWTGWEAPRGLSSEGRSLIPRAERKREAGVCVCVAIDGPPVVVACSTTVVCQRGAGGVGGHCRHCSEALQDCP